jgi:hypothetical protein
VITDARDNTLGGMYTPVDKAEQVLALLVEGCSINCQRRLNIPQFPPVEISPLSPVEISPGAERRL